MPARQGRAGSGGRSGKRRPVNHEARESRRRPSLVFGPGLALALLAAALVFWSGRRAAGPGPGFHPAPPAGNSEVSGIPAPTPAPDLAFVLRQARRLGLSDRQTHQLEKLQQQLERDTAGARAALAQASDEFARQMQARGEKGIMLPDLQAQTATVSQLSRQLATARRFYWTRAAHLLTPAQRAQAEALWARPRFGVRKRASAFSPAGKTIQREAGRGKPFALPTVPSSRRP